MSVVEVTNSNMTRFLDTFQVVRKLIATKELNDWLGTDAQKDLVRGVTLTTPEFIRESIYGMPEVYKRFKHPKPEEFESIVENEILPMLAATLDWAHCSYPVFSLPDDFFHALAVTDFGEVADEDEPFMMPFPAFFMQLPANKILLGARKLFVYRLPRWDKDLNVTWPHTHMTVLTDNLAPYTRWTNATPKGKFLANKLIPNGDLDYGVAPLHRDSDAEALRMARRVLANTLTYIESNGGLPTTKHIHGTKPQPVEREHKDRPLFRIGRTVKLAPNIRRILQEGSTGVHWKLGAKHIVRGHWRNQAYGPKLTLRRKQWIEPFWKGPETLDEAFERNYVVE